MKRNIHGSRAYYSNKHPCPYFEDGRMCTIEYLVSSHDDPRNYHEFLAAGYRRSGRLFYRNICSDCSSCLPLRIENRLFRPSRSNRRTLRKNEDVRVEILSAPFVSPEKIILYDKYVNSKHPENKNGASESEIRHDESADEINDLLNMHYGYPHIIEMNYYLNSKLIGVGIIDEGRDALSSNYFYYDTDCLDRRPGVFSIVKEIELAKSMGKKYYYLGFYIEENPKMSYKKYFRPNQVYEKGKWKELRS